VTAPPTVLRRQKKRKSLLLIPVLLLVLGVAVTACDDDDDDGGGDSGATTVDVELNEFVVTAVPDSVHAGEVDFSIENIGEETHELVIVKTDLSADSLPTLDDGSF
jgi:hypothetical protein